MGCGVPVAVTVKLFAPLVEKVALFALVIAAALLRFIVRLAVTMASVGTVVAPHVLSPASTATIDTLLRLITYVLFVALACGAIVYVANRRLVPAATGPERRDPARARVKSALLPGVPGAAAGETQPGRRQETGACPPDHTSTGHTGT